MPPAIEVIIVHDLFGRIISVNRPAKNAKVVVMPEQGHSLLKTEVDPDSILSLSHTHCVDLKKNVLASHQKAENTK